MIRFLLFALMVCLYVHGLQTGFKIGIQVKKVGEMSHIVVTGKDILQMLFMIGCAAFTACMVHL